MSELLVREGTPGSRGRPVSTRRRDLVCNALQDRRGWVPFVGDGYGDHVGRKIDVDQLVPAKVIAERLSFKGVQLVHYYFRSDPTFPAPVFTHPDAARPLRLWYWPDIEAWWADRSRRPPRADPALLTKFTKNPRSVP